MNLNLAPYLRWDVIAMCAALAIVFGFEMAGVFGSKYITITAIVRGVVPLWARAMFLGWLCYHFMIAAPK